jgi:hypothetical protein
MDTGRKLRNTPRGQRRKHFTQPTNILNRQFSPKCLPDIPFGIEPIQHKHPFAVFVKIKPNGFHLMARCAGDFFEIQRQRITGAAKR